MDPSVYIICILCVLCSESDALTFITRL
jgi:hypothetical protein